MKDIVLTQQISIINIVAKIVEVSVINRFEDAVEQPQMESE